MTHEQALKLTGEIVAATIIHMAEIAKVSPDTMLKLLADGNVYAVKRFNAYMETATKQAGL